MNFKPLPTLNDPEGEKIPDSLPFVVDAHVHLFPDPFFAAIHQWFAQYAWPVRYRMTAREIIEFQISKGVGHIVGLHYSHSPGMARFLNKHMAELNDAYPQLTGMATVFPGEEGAVSVLEDAWAARLTGVKLHAHVQFFDMDSDAMREIYALCADRDEPMVMHVGREPKTPLYDYKVDPYTICKVELVEAVLKSFPSLKICVPHLGADEFHAYQRLLERYDNLWLDVAMMLADFFPHLDAPPLAEMRLDRVMFGTDFPNIPYAWDREIKGLCSLGLDDSAMEMILSKNASAFFSKPFGLDERCRRHSWGR